MSLTSQLGGGPRADLRAIAARYDRSSPVVRTAARDVYDGYLRANRVDEGIASYKAVVRLMLGAGLDDGGGRGCGKRRGRGWDGHRRDRIGSSSSRSAG